MKFEVRIHDHPVSVQAQHRRHHRENQSPLLRHLPQKSIREILRRVPKQISDPTKVTEGKDGNHDNVQGTVTVQVTTVGARIETLEN